MPFPPPLVLLRALPMAAASCLAVFALALPLAAQSSPLHLDVQERVLDNGVTVLVWERPSAGRIGARVFYRVDVAAERPGTVGLTHMLEHYLFMGSFRVGTSDWDAERPFAEAVERIEREITDERNRSAACFLQRDVFAEVEVHCTTPRLDSLQAALDAAFEGQMRYASGTDFDWIYQPAGGTGLTASTGRDWMKFDIDLPASALELFMWMERSRVENPVFRFFEPEREVVVDQIRRSDNRPDGPFERVLRSMTYDAHPYGWAHWFSDLTRATREDHWEIFYRYFIPQNTVLVVVGEVEAEDVFRQAERYWGSWLPGRPGPRLRTVEPPPVGERRLEVTAAAGPSVVIHAPMPAVGHPDAPVFQVLAELLGAERGLLEAELVDARGLATGTQAQATPAKYPSHMMIRVNARSNEDLAAAEEGIEAVLARVAAAEVDPARLAAAVDRMVLAMARGLERVGPSAVQLGAMEVIHGWAHLNELPSLWAAVTPEDLARVVRSYLPREMRTVGVLRRGERSGEVASVPSSSHAPLAHVREETSGEDAPWSGSALAEDAAFSDAVWAWEPPRGRLRVPRREGKPMGPAADLSTAAAPPAPHGADDPVPPRSDALAEMPWYAPPWMAGYRPSRFTDAPPAAAWETLMPPREAPRLPRAEAAARELASGHRAFVAADPLLPLVQLTVLAAPASLDDPPGSEGLADLTVRSMVRGGTRSLGPEALEARLRELGATLSMQVDGHHARIHLLAPPESAVEAAGILGQIVGAPALEPGVVERERERMAVAADRALDDAPALLRHTFHAALFPAEHPLARRPTGASVRGLGPHDLVDRHRRSFRPGRAVFAVSGRFDEGALLAALDRGLAAGGAGWGAEPAPRTAAAAAAAPPEGLRVMTREFPSRQGHIMLGHRGLAALPRDPREHAALEVMNYILSGGAFVSRMMELLRTDTGITSALYGSVEPGGEVPFPYLWRFSGNPETLATGVRLAVGEIERMREGGVTEAEFEGAVTSYLSGLIPASYETPHRTVERFAQKALLGRYLYQSPGYLNYYAGDEAQVEALLSLTLEEVNAAARQWLHPDELVVVVVGPLDEIRAGAALEDLPFVTPTGG
jgi:predicted Zn-dependent peptidase